MEKQHLIADLKSSKEFLDRSTRPLAEEHSSFRPSPSQMTVAQQMAHIGQTVEWFLEGAFGAGFSLDFEVHQKETEAVTSLEAARQRVAKAFEQAVNALEAISNDELEGKLPDGPIMGGQPRWVIFPAIVEHTAHHRGALTVYSRLQGLQPPMPYGDM